MACDTFSIMHANRIKKFKYFLIFMQKLLNIVTENQNKKYFKPNVTGKGFILKTDIIAIGEV